MFQLTDAQRPRQMCRSIPVSLLNGPALWQFCGSPIQSLLRHVAASWMQAIQLFRCLVHKNQGAWRCDSKCLKSERPDALLTGQQNLLLQALQMEHDYWTTTSKAVSVRAADGSVHSLSRYYADWTAPRPEGFRYCSHLFPCSTWQRPSGCTMVQ